MSTDIPFSGRRSRRRAGTVLSVGIFLLIVGLLSLFLYPFIFDMQQKAKENHPGGMAKDYLSDERYSKLHVEIDYAGNFPPDPQALGYFEQKLKQLLDKSQIEISVDEMLTIRSQNVCVSDLIDLEEQHRDRETGGDTIVLYLLYVSGECQGEKEVAGVTYSGSAFAVYKEKIISSITTGDPKYAEHRRIAEANVLLHEFGHVVGLVNELDFQSAYDHEDPLNPNHSKYEQSIMYFEANFTEYQDFIFFDREDLKAIASAPYPAPIGLLMQLFWLMMISGIIVILAGCGLAAIERRRAPVTSADTSGTAQPVSAAMTDRYLYKCPNCGGPLNFIQAYGRWYCHNCGEYL